jgi:IS30 family transposase
MDVLRRYVAGTVRRTREKRFKKLGPELVTSLTEDLGHGTSEHKTLSDNLKIQVLSLSSKQPYSPWEKGPVKIRII